MDPLYTFGPEAGQPVNPRDDTGNILVQIVADLQGVTGPGGGPSGGGSVVGIQETRPPAQDALTAASTTIPAGALAYTVLWSTDFTGSVNGLAVTAGSTVSGPSPGYADASKPGNTLPAITITRSAGTYSIITAVV